MNETRLAEMLESTDARFDPETLEILRDTRKFCPKCESEMVLRTARQGIGAGRQFWGCSAYPRCRFRMLVGDLATPIKWPRLKETCKFRAVRHSLTGFFILSASGRANGTEQLIGTDEEALEFSVRVKDYFCGQWLRRVEARSTGQIDFAFSNTCRPRELAVLHENGKDWRAQPSRLHHGAWHKSLEDAIRYAAFRLRGHLSEIRILNRHDEVQGVVLIDQTGAGSSANGPAL